VSKEAGKFNSSTTHKSKSQTQCQQQCNYSSKQNQARACVNHVVVEDSQAAPDIIIGMILVNDNNVIVLINSGASRSFVTTNFVQKHNLPLSMLKNWKIVSSPGGDMHARHVCPKVSNLIRGVRIPSQPHSF
jgi:hypothetical protein